MLFPPEAVEYAQNLSDALPLSPSLRVLDFGCGYGHVTRLIAPEVACIGFWDAAESMRTAAARNLASVDNAFPWDEGDLDQPFDLVLVNSVVQYMTADELAGRLRQFAQMLRPGGRVILSDLSPPGHRPLADIWSLFHFSARRGYLLTAARNTLPLSDGVTATPGAAAAGKPPGVKPR